MALVDLRNELVAELLEARGRPKHRARLAAQLERLHERIRLERTFRWTAQRKEAARC